MWRIARTRAADEDLISIWLEIAADNPKAADHVLDAMERRLRQLAEYPFSGVARDDIGPDIRHLVAGRYLILYRISSAVIEIVRILHGRRNIGRDDIP